VIYRLKKKTIIQSGNLRLVLPKGSDVVVGYYMRVKTVLIRISDKSLVKLSKIETEIGMKIKATLICDRVPIDLGILNFKADMPSEKLPFPLSLL